MCIEELRKFINLPIEGSDSLRNKWTWEDFWSMFLVNYANLETATLSVKLILKQGKRHLDKPLH